MTTFNSAVFLIIVFLATLQSFNLSASEYGLQTNTVEEETPQKALEYEETNFTFESKLTGITYPIKLYVPNNYDQTDQLYPVVYATDGQ